MSVHVSWGNNHPSYNKLSKDYNLPTNIWDRYSENMKRGYVLKNQQYVSHFRTKLEEEENIGDKPKKSIPILEFISGLVRVQRFRDIGFDYLENCSDEMLTIQLKSLINETSEIFDKDYHKWGLEGDEYSQENNPFNKLKSINNSNK